MDSYGTPNRTQLKTEEDQYVEELNINGFTIAPEVLSKETCIKVKGKLELLYQKQTERLGGTQPLTGTPEAYQVRCPLLFDDIFVSIAAQPLIIRLLKKILGDHFIIQAQNGIFISPKEPHRQQLWHRDLPHQEYTSSKPLAMTALFCIDDFSADNGGTFVLPGSHRFDVMPSEQFAKQWQHQISAKAGSVLVFNSMLYHRAGVNETDKARHAINHVYCSPMLKQQINFPAALAGKYQDDPELSRLLGYGTTTPNAVDEIIRKYSKIV